jgi:predicted metal-dependent phosphoesterase TrpH
MLTGTLHIHSTYSDGEFTLAEIRDVLTAGGSRFACVTDHADSFDASRLESYRRECAALSNDRFLFIAGLEYSCVDRMHILGYGVTTLVESTDPEEVIRHIQRSGGIAVVAHPKNEAFAAIEAFNPLPDGIEVWNSKYDGQYAPRPATFALLARAQARRPDMRAFYGQDLHWKNQFRGLLTRLHGDARDANAVLGALRRGEFDGVKGTMTLPSTGEVPADLSAQFHRAHARSQTLRSWIRRAKAWVDHSGLAVPGPIKAQLRRIF